MGAGLLTRSELCEGLASFGLDIDDGPGGDVDKVMGFFDRDSEGRISIHEFHRGLRVRIDRRAGPVLVRARPDLADSEGPACIRRPLLLLSPEGNTVLYRDEAGEGEPCVGKVTWR